MLGGFNQDALGLPRVPGSTVLKMVKDRGRKKKERKQELNSAAIILGRTHVGNRGFPAVT